MVVNLDHRFGAGKDYSGPQNKFAKKIFENMGANMVMRAGSGLPYTRQKNVTSGNGDNSSAVVFSMNHRAAMKGKLNGFNLPWQHCVDLRIDKDITLVWKKKEERNDESKAKESSLNLCVEILNALNTKNILNIYRYTGDPNDDGYLSAPENQNGINNNVDQHSFRDLYESKIANPVYYSIPRGVRVGGILNFWVQNFYHLLKNATTCSMIRTRK